MGLNYCWYILIFRGLIASMDFSNPHNVSVINNLTLQISLIRLFSISYIFIMGNIFYSKYSYIPDRYADSGVKTQFPVHRLRNWRIRC